MGAARPGVTPRRLRSGLRPTLGLHDEAIQPTQLPAQVAHAPVRDGSSGVQSSLDRRIVRHLNRLLGDSLGSRVAAEVNTDL